MTNDSRPAIDKFLTEELGVEPGDVENDASLFTSRVLSSMDIVTLVTFLEAEFRIQISPLDVSLELFDKPSLIADYVDSARAES